MRSCVIGVLAVCLAGCAGVDPVDALSKEPGMHMARLKAREFELVTLSHRLPNRIEQLRVYLGSDGRPWIDNRPAADPTGGRSLALELMLEDPQSALYLGRPCYHGGADLPPCEPSLWTSARYSEPVVAALVDALQQLAERHEAHELTLIGYSGGGTLAVLAASRLPSMKVSVVTLAANLDPEAWVAFHGFLPLEGSLSPVSAVPSPAAFRQLHLTGSEDARVPGVTVQRYVERHPHARFLEIEGFDHICCWVEHWPQLLEDLALP